MDTKNLTIEEIIAYCEKQGPDAVAWLKETAAKKTEYKVYPKVVVDGKRAVDKSQEPTIEMRPISFVQLKQEFLAKFGLKEAASKKLSFHDKIAAL